MLAIIVLLKKYVALHNYEYCRASTLTCEYNFNLLMSDLFDGLTIADVNACTNGA